MADKETKDPVPPTKEKPAPSHETVQGGKEGTASPDPSHE